jgi:hypothetical protein
VDKSTMIFQVLNPRQKRFGVHIYVFRVDHFFLFIQNGFQGIKLVGRLFDDDFKTTRGYV